MQSNKNYHKKQKICLKNVIIKKNLLTTENFRGGNSIDYDFTNFSPLRDLFRSIYYGEILIPGAEREQNNFDDMLEILKKYKPRKDSKYYKLKDDPLINIQNFYDGREMIINAFKNKIFPLQDPANFPEYVSEEDITPKSSISSDSEKDESLIIMLIMIFMKNIL